MPSSSRVSRTAASRDVSPGSIRPPGPLIFPAPKPRFFRMSRMRPSRTTKSNVANSFGCQVVQSISTGDECSDEPGGNLLRKLANETSGEDAAEPIIENGMYRAQPVDGVVEDVDEATRPLFARAEAG